MCDGFDHFCAFYGITVASQIAHPYYWENDTSIGKADAVLRELYWSAVLKWELWNGASL